MLKEEISLGQIVRVEVNTGRYEIGQVEKINPKNVIVRTAAGTKYNAHPMFLSYPFAAEIDAFAPLPEGKELVPGQVVRRKSDPTELFVITDYSRGNYKIAKLGGGPRYRGLTQASLEVVEFDVAGL